jgi:predicted deacylase
MLTLILLVSAILIVVYVYYSFICNKVEFSVWDSKLPGPTVLIVGGTHGNEPAGTIAIHRLNNTLKSGKVEIKKGKLILIPEVNKCGLSLNTRFLPANLLSLGLTGSVDINRGYDSEAPGCEISQNVGCAVNQADWVIDLHEGWGFHQTDPDSMGSGVYYGNTPESKEFSMEATALLNEQLNPEKRFVCKNWDDVSGTLRSLADGEKKHYILVETTGQHDIQPLEVRVGQHSFLINQLLGKLLL